MTTTDPLVILTRHREIRDQIQTYRAGHLIEMERVTTAWLNASIRSELADRGLNRNGDWVGFEAARSFWMPEEVS